MRSFLSAVLLACAAGPLVGQAAAPTAPFTVTIATKQESCKAGDPCMIHIVLKDTSSGTLTIPQQRHMGTQGELNYHLFVWLSQGAPAKDTDYGRLLKSPYNGMSGSVIEKDLHEGDEIAEDMDVGKLVDLSNPGFYTVQVERGDERYHSAHIKSNKLTVQVVP